VHPVGILRFCGFGASPSVGFRSGVPPVPCLLVLSVVLLLIPFCASYFALPFLLPLFLVLSRRQGGPRRQQTLPGERTRDEPFGLRVF